MKILFNALEIRIQEFEQQYQYELEQLKINLLNQTNESNSMMYHQTKKLKKDISKKILSCRKTFLRHRQRSSKSKNTIRVSPEPYLDLIINPLNKKEWSYLSLGKFDDFSFFILFSIFITGPSCIRLNQCAIRPPKQQKIEIRNEHQDIYNKIGNYLSSCPHCVPRTVPIFKQFSNELYHYLHDSYLIPLSFKDQRQALQQKRIVESIRRKIKNFNLIIRVTDKGNNFYIGSAIEFHPKRQKFFADTNAFRELFNNPFHEILNKVIQLLNKLAWKKLILQWQCKKMMPDRNDSELSSLYFNPKTHKVKYVFRKLI